MTDANTLMGYVIVAVENDDLFIIKMNALGYSFEEKPNLEQIFILDSLMRSAASYGETFGANKITTLFPDFFDFFKLRGFDTDKISANTKMNTIIKYS